MKPLLLAVAAGVALAASTAHAQQPPPPTSPVARADVAGTIGWLNGNKTDIQAQSTNDWYNNGLYGGVQAGWYWTDHHKTEVEAGLTNGIDFRTYGSTTVNGSQEFRSSTFTYTLRRVAVGQHYQFFRNAWVHPHVGGGVDVTWERALEHADPIMAYDPVTGRSREVRPAGTFGPTTTVRVRPYVEAGFKAYITPRTFFRGDLRVLVRGGVDEVLLRCGFGVDF